MERSTEVWLVPSTGNSEVLQGQKPVHQLQARLGFIKLDDKFEVSFHNKRLHGALPDLPKTLLFLRRPGQNYTSNGRGQLKDLVIMTTPFSQ